MLRKYLFCFLSVMTASFLWAADEKPARLAMTIPRIEQAPTLEDFVTMEPSERMKGKLAVVDQFIQREPTDGVPATQKTIVYSGYDDKNLYFVFVCFESDPGRIRGSIARRENIDDDDTVQVMLDTFFDQRRAYSFIVNPHGIQQDRMYTEGQGADNSFDTVWDSRGKMTDRGYVVYIAVPFKSLRFPSVADQRWGIIFQRYSPWSNELDYWPANSSRTVGRLNKESQLDGLEHISPGRNTQFVPYVGFRSSRSADYRDYPNYRFHNETAAYDGGIDAKFVIKDKFVLDATVNPDFSQVESDEPQITVNERFELYYPEKRPFFLENANFFANPLSLVFTRRIADPKYGIRLTGKTGKYAIGALFADDEAPGKSVAVDDPVYGKRAYLGILRVSRDILNQSSVGLLFTDREFEGSSNRVGALDARLRLDKNWVLTAQTATSATTFLNRSYKFGQVYYGLLERVGRQLYSWSRYSYFSPGFVSEPGYIARTDVGRFEHNTQYLFRPEGKHLVDWGPTIRVVGSWDHSGTPLERALFSSMRWDLRGQTNFGVVYQKMWENLRPADFYTLTRDRQYGSFSTGFFSYFGMVRKVNFGAGYRWETRVNYIPRVGQQPELANSNYAEFSATLRPVGPLRIDNTYTFLRLRDRTVDASIFNNHIIRSKWNWQLNKELSLRFIAQYDSVLANSLRTSQPATRNFNADFLITYLLHPGTAFYVGYNSNLQNLDPDLRIDGNGYLLRPRDRMINDGRQFFIKISYLFRK